MAGVWLMDQPMYQVVLTKALILQALPPVKLHPQEAIIVAASHMILSPKDVKTELVQEDLIGMVANV